MIERLNQQAAPGRLGLRWAVIAALAGVATACGSVTHESAGGKIVDGAFQRQTVNFRSGYSAEIAMALNGPELCVAMGHDASKDGVFSDELIEKWLRLRRLSVGGEVLVGDLSFAPIYQQIDLEGVTASCVRVQPASAAVLDERIEVTGPRRVRGAF